MKTGIKSAVLVFAVFCGAIGSAPERAAGHPYASQNPAAEILARFRNACGGEALKKIATEKRTGTLVRGVYGRVPFDVQCGEGNAWCYTQTLPWGDRLRFGCDGDEAWIQDGSGVQSMDADQKLDLQLLFDVQAPLKMAELFPDLTYTGVETGEDGKAVALRAVSSEGFAVDLIFDEETGLLVRAGSISFQDYREIGAVKRPFRILLGGNEKQGRPPIKMEFLDTVHNVDVAGDMFRRPLCVLAPAPSPIFKSWKQVEVDTSALDACAGRYRNTADPGQVFAVSREGNHLMMKIIGRSEWLEIRPQSETEYFIQFLGWEFTFFPDEEGMMTRLRITAGGRTIEAERID